MKKILFVIALLSALNSYGQDSNGSLVRSNSSASTYAPLTRTLTIDGIAQDLSADRTFTSSPTLTQHLIGFGSAANKLTSSANLYYNTTDSAFLVKFAPSTYMFFQAKRDAEIFNIQIQGNELIGATYSAIDDYTISVGGGVSFMTFKGTPGGEIINFEAAGLTFQGGAMALCTEGTYTPTLGNVTNVSASTAYVTGWYRVGANVTVFGKVDIDATLAASTATELNIELPIPSDLTGDEDLGGSAVGDALASLSARIKGDIINDKASVVFKAISITNDSYSFEFSYQVK